MLPVRLHVLIFYPSHNLNTIKRAYNIIHYQERPHTFLEYIGE